MGFPRENARMASGIVLMLLLIGPMVSGTRDALAQEDPTIGLALSGGGARGFAHIGVLRVLEEQGVPVDVIAGTSIGSIIGGLYAIGYTTHDLERLATAQNWEELFAVSAPRSRRPAQIRTSDFLLTLAIRDGLPALPSSLVSGQRVSSLLSRLTLPYHGIRDFRELPIAFAAVATDLETGEAVRLAGGHLAEAIRASMSIPSALAPVKIDGQTLIDGGVARNLPAEDARALGADVIICIDTSRELQPIDSLQSITDVLNQALGFQVDEHVEPQKPYCDIYLKPWLNNLTTIDFGKIDDLIDMGYASADSARKQLRALGGRSGRSQLRDTTAVDRISKMTYAVSYAHADGVGLQGARRIASALRLDLPRKISPSQIEAAVDRIYASGPFRQVIYRLMPDSSDSGYELQLDVDPHREGRLGFDARYDSRYKASLLISGAGRKRVGYGSTVRASLRLGELARLAAAYVMPLTYRRPLSLNLDGALTRIHVDHFENGNRTEQLVVDAANVRAAVATVLEARWAVAGGLRAEYFGVDRRFGRGSTFLADELAIGPEVVANLDTYDRSVFPTRGHRVIFQALAALDPVSNASFSRVFFDWQPRWPLSAKVSLLGRLSLGASSGDLPLHHGFFLGGTFEQPVLRGRLVPLYGASTQELSGPQMQAVAAGLQLRLNEEWWVSGLWNAGRTGPEWEWSPREMRPGIGVSIGRQTFLFPAVLTLGTRGLRGPYELSLNLGNVF